MERKTKIVCTIGPASSKPDVIGRLIDAGMDVARLNFSHGTWEEHSEAIRTVRALSAKKGRPVAILQDLQGPKVRLGLLRGGSATIYSGDQFTLTTREVEGTEKIAPVTYDRLATEVKAGDQILIDDGLIHLEVLRTDGVHVVCSVLQGGVLMNHKGLNLPGVAISVPAVTEKDLTDLDFGIEQEVDYIALSFVRTSKDISKVKELLRRRKVDIPIIAKLERPKAVRNLDEILEVADGVMIARGDLGVEMPLEEVPLIQKKIIRQANLHGAIVITATQMLDSMIEHPRPTRAEVSDVANAIFDGTDAVMLSGETASGAYPIEAVRVMAKVAVEAEGGLPPRAPFPHEPGRAQTFPDAISEAACRAAVDTKARAIVAFTQTGSTARLISRFRPATSVIAFTPNEHVRNRLCLYWGVIPKIMTPIEHVDEMIQKIDDALLADGTAAKGDVLIIVSGAPIGVKGRTNLLTLHRVGEP
ncbi:MAG: pyruvate kinase [candidate division NC10 bacterium]|nr:pyruvate kinase [candidate division NC10 bacterium]